MLMGLFHRCRTPAASLVWLIGFALVGGTHASARAAESRLAKEARALFKVVDRGTSSRCRFDSSWDNRPVLAETAKRYLKLHVHADLVVSEPPGVPMQVIDPAGRETEAFCTSDDRNAVWKAAVEALQPGDDNVLRLNSTSYGFPVFNADFSRAAIVVQHFSETWRRTADGPPHRSIHAAGGAEIYAKRRGVWRRIDYDSYFTAH